MTPRAPVRTPTGAPRLRPRYRSGPRLRRSAPTLGSGPAAPPAPPSPSSPTPPERPPPLARSSLLAALAGLAASRASHVPRGTRPEGARGGLAESPRRRESARGDPADEDSGPRPRDLRNEGPSSDGRSPVLAPSRRGLRQEADQQGAAGATRASAAAPRTPNASPALSRGPAVQGRPGRGKRPFPLRSPLPGVASSARDWAWGGGRACAASEPSRKRPRCVGESGALHPLRPLPGGPEVLGGGAPRPRQRGGQRGRGQERWRVGWRGGEHSFITTDRGRGGSARVRRRSFRVGVTEKRPWGRLGGSGGGSGLSSTRGESALVARGAGP